MANSGLFGGDNLVQGLLGSGPFLMGASILANNGNVGQGLLGGALLHDRFRRLNLRDKRENAELERQDQARQARLNMAGLLSQTPTELAGPPMPGQRMGYRMEENPALKQRYTTMAQGFPDAFNSLVANRFAPTPAKPTAGMQDYQYAQNNPGYVNFLRNKQPQTNIHMPPQESERQKAYGKSVGNFYGGQFAQLQEGVQKALADNARLDRLDQLLGGVNTGAASAFTQPLKRYAKDFGMDLDAMGIRDDTAPAEAAQALASQMALELRNPAGGAGMPGAMSDKDREFLTSMVPQFTNTGEGRKLMIETRRRQNRRSLDVAKLARDYQQKRGALDAGFYDELQAFAQANPLFDDLGKDFQPQAASPQKPVGQMSNDELLKFLKVQ